MRATYIRPSDRGRYPDRCARIPMTRDKTTCDRFRSLTMAEAKELAASLAGAILLAESEASEGTPQGMRRVAGTEAGREGDAA